MRPAGSQRFPERFAVWLEQGEWIDGVVAPVHQAATTVTRRSPGVRDALSGTRLGHPAHPAIVIGPLGCWTGSLVADSTGERRAARTLVGAGVLLAIPAVATGLSDWVDTSGAERRVGFVHLVANLTTISLFAASWRARRRNSHKAGIAYASLGAFTATAAGWLGGHLSYDIGVGVNTTAFDGGPEEWTLVTRDAENPNAGSVAGVRVLIVDAEHGPYVLADRCTHRGGPLSAGTIADDCVTCPWHGSRFSLLDGSVQAGPAVAPQPTYESRLTPEGLFVRRNEVRSLRVNPVRGGSE